MNPAGPGSACGWPAGAARRRGPRNRCVLLPLILLTVGGCADLGLRPLDHGAIGPRVVRLDDVPFVPGDDGHCGPAALASVLQWSGSKSASDDLAPRLLTPVRGGTLEHDLASAARAESRLAIPIEGLEAVLEEVAAGHPVIVLQNLGLSWYPQWHYAVVTGYDLGGEVILLHSGQDAHRRMALATFRQTFERAGERALAVLPPERLPAATDRQAVLLAAAGLERAGRPAAARIAYGAILERWPDESAAHFGLGNTRLAMGDLEGAADAFHDAAASAEFAPAALNNLAHVLMLSGELEAAEAAARDALARGGPGAAVAAATLQEVQAALAASGPAGVGRRWGAKVGRTRIKICCMASASEARLAIDAGADALGLVGAMPSGPGPIADQLIAEIAVQVPPPIATFLLTSETEPSAIIDHARRARTNTLQIVDRVEPATYEQLRASLPAVRLVQVIHVEDAAAIDEARSVAPLVDALLLDSGRPRAAVRVLGGTGMTHDWAVSQRIVEGVDKPVFLAGGLSAANVGRAIAEVRPFGVDLCTGVRTEGRLDPEKLEAFITAVRTADFSVPGQT